MSTNFETSITGSSRSSHCPVQWEDPSLVGKYSPWQAFDSAYSTPMLEPSLMDIGLDTKIYGLSDLPEMDVIHALQPQNIAAQDYSHIQRAFKLEAEVPSLDMAISPEPSTHSMSPGLPSMSPDPGSPGCFPAKQVKGFRTERRRAQNRKAQREFRARKDKSLQSLQIEVDILKLANQNLSMENEARVHENLELKADLELRLLGHASGNGLLGLGVLDQLQAGNNGEE